MNQLDIIQVGAYYLFQTSKDGSLHHDIVEELRKYLKPPTQSKVMTIAEAFVEEGRQEGLQKGCQEGLQKGRQEGEAALLTRLLKRRFPKEVTDRHLYLINEAHTETLSLWGEKLMDVKNIDEIFVDF